MASSHSEGHPLYYFYGSYHQDTRTGKRWPSTPASMVGFMAETAAVMLAWTGSRQGVDAIAVPMADYLLHNGTTPVHWPWPSMPYASSDPGAHSYDGATSTDFGGDGVGDGVRTPTTPPPPPPPPPPPVA